MFKNQNPEAQSEQKTATLLAVEYWRTRIVADSRFNPQLECLGVLHVDARRTICGHHFITSETKDELPIHPREVFRPPIKADAKAIILVRNQISGEPIATTEDVQVARHLMRAGELLRIDVLDYVIVGRQGHTSLRPLGHFQK